MAGPGSRERQLPLPIPVQEGEVSTRFAEVIVRNITEGIDRVIVFSDGVLSVAWGKKGDLSAHHHDDIWSVMRQNRRVINRFFGIPVAESEQEEAASDPEPEITLPQVRDRLLIKGEVHKAQGLATHISEVITMSIDPEVTAERMQRELSRLRGQLSPNVRNTFQVETRENLDAAATSETTGEATIFALEAMKDQLLRAQEGTSIVRSLYARAGTILDWVDKKEAAIRILKNGLHQALEEMNADRIERVQIDAWRLLLLNRLEPVLAISANPYATLVRRREVQKLRDVRGAIDTGEIEFVQKTFEPAYVLLQQSMLDRDVRERGREWQRFRLPPKQRGRR